jgi:hypothetical protein
MCPVPHSRSPQKLIDLFAEKAVVDLPTIRSALGDASVQTAFRYLKLVPYRRSYDHNGRYYALYRASRFDRSGLWSFEGIHFSVDGSLRSTVRRLVWEAPAGATHSELQLVLRLRVHNTLLDLSQKGEICRESLAGFYVYLHSEQSVRDAQLRRRREQLAAQQTATEVTDSVVIEVLLVLVRYPGAHLAEVVRRLRGHAPPIGAEHVRIVFERYDLERLGEKGGR